MIYKYKTEGRSLKDFRNSQNLMELLKDLSNINPKEVLKGQISFKSDLGEINKWNPKSKSEDQIKRYTKCWKLFLREKSHWFF